MAYLILVALCNRLRKVENASTGSFSALGEQSTRTRCLIHRKDIGTHVKVQSNFFLLQATEFFPKHFRMSSLLSIKNLKVYHFYGMTQFPRQFKGAVWW